MLKYLKLQKRNSKFQNRLISIVLEFGILKIGI